MKCGGDGPLERSLRAFVVADEKTCAAEGEEQRRLPERRQPVYERRGCLGGRESADGIAPREAGARDEGRMLHGGSVGERLTTPLRDGKSLVRLHAPPLHAERPALDQRQARILQERLDRNTCEPAEHVVRPPQMPARIRAPARRDE